jgi:hypothetical protein
MAEEKDLGVDVNTENQSGDVSEQETEQKIETQQVAETEKSQLSDEEMEKKIQREVDARLAKALKTREQNLKKEIEKQQKEKDLRDQNKYKELLDEKERELEDMKREITREKMDIAVGKALQAKGMDVNFAKFIQAENEDEVDGKVDELDKLVRAYAQRQIEDLKGTGFRVKTDRKGGTVQEEALRNEIRKYTGVSQRNTNNIFKI